MNPKCRKFVVWDKYEYLLEVQCRIFVGQFFVLWLPYATAGGATSPNWIDLLPCTHCPPSPLYLLIGDYHSLIRYAWCLALIFYLVHVSLSRHPTSLEMLALFLISMNVLELGSNILCSKNLVLPYYHYILRMKYSVYYHIRLIYKNETREWASLCSCNSYDMELS